MCGVANPQVKIASGGTIVTRFAMAGDADLPPFGDT
jgi:hypothetical protein